MYMRYQIEVGTEEQKKDIENELSLIPHIFKEMNIECPIYRIIVPVNFDKTVNIVSGTTSYSSGREEQMAIAKVINDNEGVTIVFSKILYTLGYDHQVGRSYICMKQCMY